MFNLVKNPSMRSVQKLVNSVWITRIVMILAIVSVVDLLLNLSFHKFITTGIVLLMLYGISKMFKSVRRLWNKGVRYFKKLSLMNRIMVFLATNSVIDLGTSLAFYKLIITGLFVYFSYRILKSTKLYSVIASIIYKAVKKFRKLAA